MNASAPSSILLYRYLDASAALKTIEARSFKVRFNLSHTRAMNSNGKFIRFASADSIVYQEIIPASSLIQRLGLATPSENPIFDVFCKTSKISLVFLTGKKV